MADAKELLKDVPDEIAGKLLPIIEETISNLNKEKEDLSKKFEEAKESRQEAKNKLKMLTDQIATGEFEGAKLLKDQIAAREAELEAIKQEKESITKKLAEQETILKEIDESTRAELKENFTEEEWKEIEHFSITDLRKVAKLKVKVNVDKSKGFQARGQHEELTAEQKLAKIYKS